jgi:DNA mismatch repair ATPase MutS
MNDISAIAYYALDLLRGIFLVEVHLLDRAYAEMHKKKSSVKDLFIYVGDLDGAISIASLKATNNVVTCTPDFTTNPKTLYFKDAIHPLIENCQGNSFFPHNASALITGSNMSGKSTFLRTLIINIVMSRSLHLCFASEARLSMALVYSSISIADDLSDNKSFYLQEVSVIQEMVRQSQSQTQNIFVIDEIFKGTNTMERIALATAILHYLDNSNSLVIATSHDIQLTESTSDTFRQFHFSEHVDERGIRFDFTIREGPSGVGNAIRLVESVGYPTEVVRAAKMNLRMFGASLT